MCLVPVAVNLNSKILQSRPIEGLDFRKGVGLLKTLVFDCKLLCNTKLYKLKSNYIKELERKVYTSQHQDGLIDIFASIYIIGFSIGILLDYIWDFSFGVLLPGILVVLVVPLWITAKRRITMPRIGYVNFGTRGKTKITAIFTGILVLGTAFFFAFTSPLPKVLTLNNI